MEAESIEIIDVIGVESSSSDLPQIESIQSIQPKWLKPPEVQRRCRLEKTALQQAITKLTDKYNVPLQLLRRGAARNTEYSAITVDLLKALKSGDELEIRKILANAIRSESGSGVLVIASKNIQVAQQQNLTADENFKSAKVNLGNAMANLRELGRSFGKKAVNEFKAGFGEEVDAGLKDLGIQAETVFDVEA